MKGNSKRSVTTFSPETLTLLRDKSWELQESMHDLRGVKDGWRPAPVDPNGILSLFPTLRLKEGYRLVGFQFTSHGNANGIVLAWPADEPVPDPPADLDDPFSLQNFLQAHLQMHLGMGGWQVGNYFSTVIMPAIEGDGSPRSYLEASIFGREIYEFGAEWHGCDWSAHHLVDGDPFTQGISTVLNDYGTEPRGPFYRDAWTVDQELPADWSPTVTMTPKQARVEFYTYSALGWETLNLHRDTYTQGNYQCRSNLVQLARGDRGYIP